jgi:Zn-dependent peptidase ImmA (M78 family)
MNVITQRRNSAHTGRTDRIRQMLEEQPAKARELAKRLNVSIESVKSTLAKMCSRTGGIAAVPWSARNDRLYATVKWIKDNDPNRGVKAEIISIGRGSKWLGTGSGRGSYE